MELNKLEEFLKELGFTIHSSSGDKLRYDFVNFLGIYCEVNMSDESFKFLYITPKFHQLIMNWASPISNEKHFKKLYTNFAKEAIGLESTRNI